MDKEPITADCVVVDATPTVPAMTPEQMMAMIVQLQQQISRHRPLSPIPDDGPSKKRKHDSDGEDEDLFSINSLQAAPSIHLGLCPELEKMATTLTKSALEQFNIKSCCLIVAETGITLNNKDPHRSPVSYYTSTEKKATVMEFQRMGCDMSMSTVVKWSVKDSVKQAIESKWEQQGWALSNLMAALSKSADSTKIAMVQHSLPGKLHYHILIFSSDEGEMRQKQVIRAMTAQKLRGFTKFVKKESKEIGWWLLHALEPRQSATYLGANESRLNGWCKVIYDRLVKWESKESKDLNCPEVNLDAFNDIREVVDPAVAGLLDDDCPNAIGAHSIEVSRSTLIQAHKNKAKLKIMTAIITKMDPKNADVDELMKLASTRLTDLEECAVITHIPRPHSMFWIALGRYFREQATCPLIHMAYKRMAVPSEAVGEVRHYLEGQSTDPNWGALIYNALYCLNGFGGKRNTFYVWENRGDQGKSTWFRKAMVWCGPIANCRVDLGEHRFEALQFPHRLCVLDDQNCVITKNLLGDIKALLEGGNFEVNVKYARLSTAKGSPVFYLNNEENLHLQDVNHAGPLNNRMYKMNINDKVKLPTIWNMHGIVLFWKWAQLCFKQSPEAADYVVNAPKEWLQRMLNVPEFDAFARRVCVCPTSSNSALDDAASYVSSMFEANEPEIETLQAFDEDTQSHCSVRSGDNADCNSISGLLEDE